MFHNIDEEIGESPSLNLLDCQSFSISSLPMVSPRQVLIWASKTILIVYSLKSKKFHFQNRSMIMIDVEIGDIYILSRTTAILTS